MLLKLFLIDQLDNKVVMDIIPIIKLFTIQVNIIMIDPPNADQWKFNTKMLIKNDITYKRNILFGFGFNPKYPFNTFVRNNKIYYRLGCDIQFKVNYKKYKDTHYILKNLVGAQRYVSHTSYNEIISFYLIPKP